MSEKNGVILVQSMVDDCETNDAAITHKVGDRDCSACKDRSGKSYQEYCGRVLDLVIKNGEKESERRCTGRVHVSRFIHGDRAYWIEVISVCDQCGELKSRGE